MFDNLLCFRQLIDLFRDNSDFVTSVLSNVKKMDIFALLKNVFLKSLP